MNPLPDKSMTERMRTGPRAQQEQMSKTERGRSKPRLRPYDLDTKVTLREVLDMLKSGGGWPDGTDEHDTFVRTAKLIEDERDALTGEQA